MKKLFLTLGITSVLAFFGALNAQTNAQDKGSMKPLSNQEKETARPAKEMPVEKGDKKAVQQSSGTKSNSESSVLAPGETSAKPAEEKQQPEELKNAPR